MLGMKPAKSTSKFRLMHSAYLLSGSMDRKSLHVSSTRHCHKMRTKSAVQQIKSSCRPRHPIASVAGPGQSVNFTPADERNSQQIALRVYPTKRVHRTGACSTTCIIMLEIFRWKRDNCYPSNLLLPVRLGVTCANYIVHEL